MSAGSLLLLLRQPRRHPDSPPRPPDNLDSTCGRCRHLWHGLECRVSTCSCATAWTDPAQFERAQS